MSYCPECEAEYREGIVECMDCHVPLRPGAAPIEMDEDQEETGEEREAQLVRIRVFSGPTSLMQADLAKNLLETENIPCVLPGQIMGEILPGVESIQMFVHESDADRADEILRAYMGDPRVESAE